MEDEDVRAKQKKEIFIMDDMSTFTGIKQASGVPAMNGQHVRHHMYQMFAL